MKSESKNPQDQLKAQSKSHTRDEVVVKAQEAIVKEFKPKIEPEHELPVNEVLRQARLKKGISVSDLAGTLRISQVYIHCIESGEVKDHLERVYALGFVRTYARFLGMNPEEIVQRFKVEILSDPKEEKLDFPKPALESNGPREIILIISAILIILGFGGWYAYNSLSINQESTEAPEDVKKIINGETSSQAAIEEPATERAPSIVETHQNAETVEPTEEGAAPQETIPPEAVNITGAETVVPFKPSAAVEESTPKPAGLHPLMENREIKLSFSDPAWLELRGARGDVLIRKNFRPGETYTVKYKPGLKISTGNAAGVTLSVNGKEGKVLGKKGEIKRITLDQEFLNAYTSSE